MGTTLRRWFNQIIEPIDQIVFQSKNEWDQYEWWYKLIPVGVVSFDSLSDTLLDHVFDTGYGSNDSPNFCAWTEHFVVFSDNYDGAESICAVPRHPVMHDPIRPGGG